jgi:hypothetical protein
MEVKQMKTQNKNQPKRIIEKVKKWYNHRNRQEIMMIWMLLSLFVISLIFYAGVSAWNGYHGLYISQSSCVNIGVETALQYRTETYWQILLIQFMPIIKMLLLSIAIAWVLHGVQLRIFA